MAREVDLRNFEDHQDTAARENALQESAMESSALLPGDQAIRIESLDPVTGNPSAVAVSGGPAEQQDYVQRALAHVQTVGPALGIVPGQPAEFAADPNVQETSSSAATVHLQQLYKGIPIFDAALAVRFEPDGALRETVGTTVTVTQNRPLSTQLSVTDAVMRAAQHVSVPAPDEEDAVDQFGEPLPAPAVDLSGFQPRVTAAFTEQPDTPTVLEAGPFGDQIKARLIWFPLGDNLRLAWEVIIAMPGYQGLYRTLVDGETGEILYCHQLLKSVAAQGNVYRMDGGSNRQTTAFPRPLADYGLPNPPPGPPLPNGFPDTWVETNRTVGNGVNAHQGDAGASLQGTPDQTGLLSFNPADGTGNDQQVLNIFYYNAYMHDFFYLLGFREADGNFQVNNFNRGGLQSDRVDARAHPGAVWGTANMATPIDGQSPVMNMGLVTNTNRHTAFDSDVVFHEFMHGVTNRLVGGPLNSRALDAPQSGGMGEGWGDYIACVINNRTAVGAWVVNDARGIRGFPYDTNFPDNFGDLGTGRYSQVHNIGEIWCATLMEMTRTIGKVLALQLVVDALKLSPANPSFLDMRDAILRALDDKLRAGQIDAGAHAPARLGIWRAFAKFGMGPGARSNGAQLTGIVADFTVQQPAQGDDMQPGETLAPGQTITSANGRFSFTYQFDGNLVLYRNSDRRALWASVTHGKPAGVCVMQGDGNLVIYTPAGAAIWASGTPQHAGSRLVVQDDGNVVIYRPDNRAVWATNTWVPTGPTAQGEDMQPGETLAPGQAIAAANGNYAFTYQFDGNLVLYRNSDRRALWASATHGRPSGVCIMQRDGNLVIYTHGGTAIWSSGTWQHAGSRLVVQNDANVVIYRPDNRAVWATNTWLPMGPAAQGDDMQPGETLAPGQTITSANGRFSFTYQFDGNLVLYRNSDRRALWASGTYRRPSGVCIMQRDGNLVIYTPGGAAIWSSGTWRHASSRLVAQNDANVVIYRPDNRAVWATNTVQ